MTEEPPQKTAVTRSGIASAPATTLFRVTNFELYAKPNKIIMVVGVTVFLSCCTYLYQMRQFAPTKVDTKTSNDGGFSYSQKSKWDS